ncbi:membrane protein [Actinorhabdospora filicis]|uniref:Membrane protein n=1 Tax=Actinorhabdospora filicis TaxID=1785913 RepID=A0A9W6SWH9_9ACTN|nr:PDGLE domain-containing protein [Actinorhabdospora filicis]GLZ82016.1 membrane protein [Actinorhabdospora filicis]
MSRPKVKLFAFIAGGLLVAAVLAGVVSNFAYSAPDGLDSVSREGCTFDENDEITGGECMAKTAREHEVGGPLADYAIKGIDNPVIATGLSGLIGVAITFAIGGGAFWLVRHRRPKDA